MWMLDLGRLLVAEPEADPEKPAAMMANPTVPPILVGQRVVAPPVDRADLHRPGDNAQTIESEQDS